MKDREAWRASVHVVAKSQTWLIEWTASCDAKDAPLWKPTPKDTPRAGRVCQGLQPCRIPPPERCFPTLQSESSSCHKIFKWTGCWTTKVITEFCLLSFWKSHTMVHDHYLPAHGNFLKVAWVRYKWTSMFTPNVRDFSLVHSPPLIPTETSLPNTHLSYVCMLKCALLFSAPDVCVSVHFSDSVVPDFLRPHGLQNTRLLCLSPMPGVYPNLCPLSQWCHPSISSSSPPAFNLSQHQGLFQWVSSLHQVVKVLEFQLQHQSFQIIFRADFFRMDWLDLLAVQGTLKSLLQDHTSKTSILQCSAFFRVQLSHLYTTIGKNHSFD